jgi:Ca2+-binding RTX toxin-like protein
MTTVDLLAGFAIRADGFDTIANVESVETGSSTDTITGTQGANTIKSGGGADLVLALNGDDKVYGDAGKDTIFGHAGEDTIFGGSGNDQIDGGSGDDEIKGTGGNDRIRGGSGDDTMWGGGAVDALPGANTFVWEVNDLGYDMIKDFDLAKDKLAFGDNFFAAGPGGAVDLSDVLLAWNLGGGDCALVANTSWAGWQGLAFLDGVNAVTLQQKIDNGTILDVEVAGGGGAPGGFGVDAPNFDIGLHLGFLL